MTPEVRGVFAGLLAVLVVASMAGWWLARTNPSAAVANLNTRIRAWWVMIVAGGAVLALGRGAVAILFAVLAWRALAEFMPSGWHFALVPAQFLAVALGYTLIAALLIPLSCLFLNRTQRIGLLLCVFGLSWIAALERGEWMLYLVLVVQASDVLQYLWGRAVGQRPVAPRLSPSKTVEGLVGGVATATALGAALHYLTPFTTAIAALVSLLITTTGFVSGLVLSAEKRRRGIKDWGTAIAGHGGVLDRVDSLCLSAPLFYLCLRLAS